MKCSSAHGPRQRRGDKNSDRQREARWRCISHCYSTHGSKTLSFADDPRQLSGEDLVYFCFWVGKPADKGDSTTPTFFIL